jgi:predicted RecA/RadA family phage recombinase
MDSVDLRGQPSAPTADQTTNTNQLASTSFVRTAIADLIDSSPALLDTLAELAAAIGDDANFATTVANSIATKVALDGSVAMTGELTLSGNPTQNLSAVTKQYVDQAINNQMIYSTDDVQEGTTNLYYTDGRVRGAVSLDSDNTVVLDYDSVSGEFTYRHPTSDGVLEGSTNLYFSQARARQSISMNSDDGTILSYSSSTGEITFTTPDTDKIVEGQTNLYFTTARARNTLSNGSNISYDSATGIISTQAAVWSVNGQVHDVILDTDDITEGSANLYFTNARARTAVSLTTDNSNILSYNTASGVFTFATPSTDAIAEGSVNLYYTDARVRAAVSGSGDISYNQATGNFSYSTPTTDGVNEGSTNLYFTNARARSAVSLTSDNTAVLSYDNATGTFTFSLGSQTTDDVQEGSTNLYYTDARARNAVSLSSSWNIVSYNSTTGVITVSAPSTDDVTEGTNLYYTTARVRADVSAVDAGGDGSFSYDSATGAFTYTGPSATEVRAHLSATSATGAQYDSATGVISLSGIPNSSLTNSSVTVNGATVSLGGSTSFDTGSVTEGTNVYYTDTRARAAVSLTSDNTSVLDYDSITGEIGRAHV